MPEHPNPKPRLHPFRIKRHHAEPARDQGVWPSTVAYAELQVTSNFTFLTGASHPEELVEQAAALGYRAMAMTDRNSLAGIVRAHIAAKETGVQLVVGCRIELKDEAARRADEAGASDSAPLSILVYPTNRAAYSRLCRLLTVGKRRAPKGECHLALHDLIEHQEGMLAVVTPPAMLDQHFLEVVRGLRDVFTDDRLSLAIWRHYGDDDAARLAQLAALSTHLKVPLVATNDVHYHIAERRAMQDVLTCIREGCTIHHAGFRLFPNGERCLKAPDEMACLFMEYPDAIERTIEIARRTAGFNLDELKYEYPDEICPPGRTPMEHLIDLTWKGAAERFPPPRAPGHGRAWARADNPSVPERVREQLRHEFELISELDYAPYFLTVHDLVTHARSQGILCQGRGAAANSAVCYCLGVTAVDPARIDLLFERFISRERNEPPDIDIDFEHERREEVIQYIYRKYGRDRAALTAEVITYRGRSAVRDVGKALGLSLDCVDRLAKDIDWWLYDPSDARRIAALGLNPDDPTIRLLCTLSHEILGFPRHLSQHVGGFVITRSKLHDLVPIENAAMDDRTVIEWDKDDIDAMGMLKVDVLGLGMLTAISKAFALLNADGSAHASSPPCRRPELQLHTIPPEDPAVYDMICAADTVGVFQIESRAQMTMLPRLRPRCYYDLVIEVAIVRPGPIQGNMVHPYLRRRNGEEPVTYPDEAVERVLGKTLGVPLFQEQAMNLAIVAAGFTPGEADALRRAMAAWKRKGDQIYRFGQRLIKGMLDRGYPREFAERCFEQIKGFSEYGFPESHAASFALLVYVSAWIKAHHPAAFVAAIINSQPMGFYAPAQLVRDAQEHGVHVRPVDVNCSAWDCTLEEIETSPPASSPSSGPALRLGLRLVKGLRRDEAQHIADIVRQRGPFHEMHALWRASGVCASTMKCLASADAFGSMGLDRQKALWHVRALRDERLPIFEQAVERGGDEPRGETTPRSPEALRLPPVSEPRKVIYDYASLGLSLKAHPLSFIRESLQARSVARAIELKSQFKWPTGAPIRVAGMVLVRQRPATASGIVFMTIEDETGIANLIVRPNIYERFRRAARHAVLLLAHGHIERQGDVVHVLAHRLEDIGHELADLTATSRDFH